ncbi:MAG: restriction endonuclease [Cyanobacteria bacterium]|nr:restriction endonuclease [Cyanobacteriota bacterium]
MNELILPSEIPWAEIKGSSLEELLYWLFDSMGAKDLEWRIGGKGAGTADQGRDLELCFFVPSPDGTLSKQAWWVEAKGRTGTVEASEVQRAIFNAAGKPFIEVLVIATNTNFSNPTRDWVKEWQVAHPRPMVKLWERTELENICSRNPLAVVRLHARALSVQGKVQVASTKLWEYASLSDQPTLESIWEKRDEVDLDHRALFALAASEIANGDIGLRSWALLAPENTLIAGLANGLVNILFLAFRANDMGVRQEPLIRTIAYLILVATKRVGVDSVTSLLSDVWNDDDGVDYPDELRETILEPVLGVLQRELRDVCADDCSRVMTESELLQKKEIEIYWERLRVSDGVSRKEKHFLTIESYKEPCKVGFDVGKETGCPLLQIEKPQTSIEAFMSVVGRVLEFRTSNHKDV